MAINRLNPDYPDAGMVQLVPTSVAVGSGTGSIDGNGTISFSGVSSISFNGVFTSSYKNYRLIYTGTSSVTSINDLFFRLRASGSDNTSSNYFAWRYVRTNTASANYYGTGTSCVIGVTGNISWFFVLDLLNPQTTDRTQLTCSTTSLANSDNGAVWSTGSFNDSVQFDGATIIPSSGTISGTVSIYGYRN